MEEIWKPIAGYDSPKYEVSNLGRIRRSGGRQYAKVMKPVSGGYKGRYLQVRLWRDHKVAAREYVHRLVAIHFLGDPPTPARQVNHKNFDTTDNRAENLEWTTARENALHAGPRMVRGGWKITDAQVHEIRTKFATGRYSKAALGREYGISAVHCYFLVTNKSRNNEQKEGAIIAPPPK